MFPALNFQLIWSLIFKRANKIGPKGGKSVGEGIAKCIELTKLIIDLLYNTFNELYSLFENNNAQLTCV